MSSTIPHRKRDRLRERWETLVNRPLSADTASWRAPARPTAGPPRTNDPFLEEALRVLTKREQSVIAEHITSDIESTVQAAYSAAKDKKGACERKKWPGADKVDKVILWLDRFKSVGDIVSNVDPIHVGLPWAGIRILLEAAVADSHQMSALVSGMDLALCMANRLRAYFIYYQRLPPAPDELTTDNLRKALISLYAHVLRFLARAIQVYSMNTAARKAQAFWQDSDLTNFESACDKLGGRADIEANNCDRALRAKQWTAAAQWKTELATTLLRLDSIQSIESSLNALHVKVDLSNLLRIQEATYNSTVEEKLSRCLSGTRSQILQDITQWADQRDGKPIFWLCGQAGTGKSTISRTVAYIFDKRECLGASFFFKRGEMNRSNADHFFSTITAQLADMIPQLQAPVAAALDRDSFLCGRGIQEQFEKLLLVPLMSIDPTHLLRKTITVVIDALDECDRDTDIRTFLRLLTQVNARSALSLRIFLTSRPELPIRLGFRQIDGSLHQDVVLEEVQETTIHGDIRAYFDNEFAKMKEDQLLRRSSVQLPKDWPSEQKRQKLVTLAVPLFIFATTVCRFVSESTPQERLEAILEQQYSAGSSQLAKLYLPILDQSLHEKEEEEQQEILAEFREVVGPIVLAADPLSVTSLASLLRLDTNEIDRRLEQLHSVLQVPLDASDPVRLLHLSFRDFLVDSKRKDKSGFWLNEVDTHRKLASGCLRRLNESTVLKSDICCIAQPGARRAEYSGPHVARHIPPDIAYACNYWPLHLVKSGQLLLDDSSAYAFLKQHLLHWLEALSWLGRISIAVSSISDLLSIARGNGSAAVSSFLQDAKQFVLQNRHVIDLAPLQAYHSAIIFTPTNSIVRRTFHDQVPQLWTCLPELRSNWSAEMQKLEGHNSSVTAVVFSPDGQVVASASDDKTVRLWNATTGEQIQKLEGHDSYVNAVAFSPDGQIIASASYDETVRLWNAATGKQTQRLTGHDSYVNAVAFSPDGQVIMSASYDQTVRLWDAATGEQTQKLEGHNSSVRAVAFSPDGQVIASASDDRTVRLWNATTGKQTRKLEGHNSSVRAVVFSPDGQVIASALGNKTVQLWNAATGEQMQNLEGHNSYINAVAFSPDGQIIASVSDDRSVWLWNAANNKQTQKLEGHDNYVNAVAFSPDGQVIASASGDKTVRLWNAAMGEQTQKLERHNGWVKAVAFSPDGQVIASASDDQTVRLWNAATGEQTQKLEGHNSSVRAVAFSPDGRVVASALGDKTVWLWDATTGKQIDKLEGHNSYINAVAFSTDGQIVASALDDWSIRLWNTATGEQMQKLKGHDGLVRAVAFLLDRQVIASASDDKTLRLWNAATGKQTQKLEGHDSSVIAVAFSSDGKFIASASDDKTVRLWNAATGEQRRKLEGHNSSVRAIAFSPDDQVIVSASDDRTMRLWNAATGEQMQKLEGHISSIRAVAFSPSGQVIVSGSDDRSVRLWNAATGEQMRNLEGHDSFVNIVAFSPDGQVIVSASGDKTVRLWSAATGEQTQKLEGHDSSIRAVTFSPDGQVIASASNDRSVRFWSATTGEMIHLTPDFNTIFTIKLSADWKSLQSEVGISFLEDSISDLPIDTFARTSSLEVRDHWVRNQDEDLLWLPHEYRGNCSATHEQTLVIGQKSGAVSIFTLR